MKLRDLIVATKSRKGEASGITKRGAYWLVGEPIEIRSYGGNGIGNSAADVSNYLEIRHYRSGEVRAVVHRHSWHQNYGSQHSYSDASGILDCETIEDVIVGLKGVSVDGNCAYSDWGRSNLVAALTKLGMALAEPAPDEEAAV